MEYRQLGSTNLYVSAICLGTMTYGQQNTEAEAHEQLDYAVAQGINFIDTAEMYPVPPKAETYTKTETIVGNWLKHQARDKLIVATKIAGPRRGLKWIRGGPSSLNRANIREAVDASLLRLQTDYIDLYQLHWPERNVPMFGQYQFDVSHEFENGEAKAWVSIEEQLATLSDLVKEGKIRHFGLSNEQAWGVMEFVRIANEKQLPRIASIQNCYSLLNRTYEFGLAEIGYRENVGLLAYSPLAFGHLTGKYLEGGSGVGRASEFKGFAQRYEKPNVKPACAAYAHLAQKYQLSPTELALSFVYHRWFVASTIIGATTMEQLKENMAAWNKPLSAEILQAIELIHLNYMNPAP